MPFRIMFAEGSERPTPLCEVCGEPIGGGDGDGYKWPVALQGPGAVFEMTFLHRGPCLQTYRARNKVDAGMEMVEIGFPAAQQGTDRDVDRLAGTVRLWPR